MRPKRSVVPRFSVGSIWPKSLTLQFAVGAALVAAIPLVVTGFMVDRSNGEAITTSVERNHESALEQATVAIETSIEAIFTDLHHLAGGPVLHDLDAGEDVLLAELTRFVDPVRFPIQVGSLSDSKTQRPFEDLALFNRFGETEVATDYHFSSEWSTTKWMNTARQGFVSYSPPHLDKSSRVLVVSIGVPVFDADGDVVRIVGAEVEMGRVLSLANLEGFAIRDGIDLRLLDRFDNYIAGVPNEQLLDRAPPFPERHGDSIIASFRDGDALFVGGDQIVGAGTVWAREGWRIRSYENAATAYAEINTARIRLVIGFLTGFLLIVILSIVVGRGLTGPIRRITRAVSAFGAGNLDARLRPASATELSTLAESFNAMADSLQESHLELVKIDKAKNDFISSLSHELRTPLAAMIGFVEILRKNRDGEFSSKTIERLDVIGRNGRRLEVMISDLLDLTRIEKQSIQLDMNWFDVKGLVEDIALSMENILTNRSQELTVNIDHGPAWLHGDKNRIAQVLTNLVSNASKYSERGNPVTVDSVIEQDQLKISVGDRGTGIKPEDMDQLFTLFYRTEDAANSSTPGTGIGLFVSKRMVELHGGSVELDSRYGEGTTVTVFLPGITETMPAELVTPERKGFSNRFGDPELDAAS